MEILQKIGEGYEGSELTDFLRNNSFSVSKESYVRKFSVEETVELNTQFLHKSKELAKIELDKKKVLSEFSAKTKGLKTETITLMDNLLQDGETIKGELFAFQYEETREMGIYDANGNLMYKRSMSPKERQIFLMQGSHIKAMTGTND